MILAVSDFFRTANYLEAGLWFVLGAGLIVASIRARSWRAFAAGVTLVAFGFSDIVETTTGAWWRPWWLLAWKALCVAVLLALLTRHIHVVRRRRGA